MSGSGENFNPDDDLGAFHSSRRSSIRRPAPGATTGGNRQTLPTGVIESSTTSVLSAGNATSNVMIGVRNAGRPPTSTISVAPAGSPSEEMPGLGADRPSDPTRTVP